MKLHSSPIRLTPAAVAAAMTLLAPGRLWADEPGTLQYYFQPIFTTGAMSGTVATRTNGSLAVGSLNDNGEILFVAQIATGGQALLQYADKKFTQIAAVNEPAPFGKWPADLAIWGPVSMNASGDAVFSTTDSENGPSHGTFRWNHKRHLTEVIALKGMPAVEGMSFAIAGGPVPVINSRGESAFVAQLRKTTGQTTQTGVFFQRADGGFVSVAIPDQALSDGRRIISAWYPSLNDSGQVAFLARVQGEAGYGAYLWDQGTITPIMSTGSAVILANGAAPSGKAFSAITGVRLNSKNHDALLGARLSGSLYVGLYRFTNGQLTAVVEPGHAMPGGGSFKSLLNTGLGLPGVSYANDAGQYAFMARLEDNSTAAYLMQPDSQLSLILKSGTYTTAGYISSIGPSTNNWTGIGLNNKGQVALTTRITYAPELKPAVMAVMTPITSDH